MSPPISEVASDWFFWCGMSEGPSEKMPLGGSSRFSLCEPRHWCQLWNGFWLAGHTQSIPVQTRSDRRSFVDMCPKCQRKFGLPAKMCCVVFEKTALIPTGKPRGGKIP